MDFEGIDGILEDYRRRGYYPSAACQIFDREKTLYHKAFGNAALGIWYDLASVSKIICTTMLLQAMEEGKLAPEDLALEHLRGEALGPVTKERLRDVSILRLMTHTSGLLPWYPFYADGREFYTALEHALATSAVEEGMAYSDLNFMLLGQIFTCVTGLTLREGLERYIKAGMGIREIAYGPVEPSLCAPSCYGNQIEKRMCAERGIAFDGWRPDGVEVRGTCNDGNAYYYWKGASGHAGTFGSSRALTKLCQFYLNTEGSAFLHAMDVNVSDRGLGFDKSEVYPEGCGHSGFTGTSIWFSRRYNIGAVILTNKYYRREEAPDINSNEFRRAVHYALLEMRKSQA